MHTKGKDHFVLEICVHIIAQYTAPMSKNGFLEMNRLKVIIGIIFTTKAKYIFNKTNPNKLF